MARKVRGGAAAQVAARVNATLKSSAVTMASDDKYNIRRVPTGILTIDRMLNGGFARGRHAEIFGDWLVGKSLIIYRTLALAQERGEVCALIDAENVFSAAWFKHLGGRPDELIMGQSKNAHALGNILRVMIDKREMQGVDIIAIDSVASLLPREEEEQDLDENVQPANLARLMSILLRQLTMQNQDTVFLWTNQWRDKISHIPNLKSTPGGKALGFYASTRLEITQNEKEMEEVETVFRGKLVKRKRVIGRWINCTVRKEKTGARPESTRYFFLDYDSKQPDLARELLDLGIEDGLVFRIGDYFSVPEYDDKRVHGIKRILNKINTDAELQTYLVTEIQEKTDALGGEIVG
jgi:recombination protein RecA